MSEAIVLYLWWLIILFWPFVVIYTVLDLSYKKYYRIKYEKNR